MISISPQDSPQFQSLMMRTLPTARWIFVTIIGTLISAVPVSGQWNIGTPMVTYWNDGDTSTLTPEIAQQAIDGGYNVVWVHHRPSAPLLATQLAIAEQYGLRVNLTSPLLNDDNIGTSTLNALIDQYSASPAANSYHIPGSPKQQDYPELSALVDYLRVRDPDHMAYITFNFHVYQNSSVAQFVSDVDPDLISFNNYNFLIEPGTGQNRDQSYFADLATVATGARQVGLPFVNHVQAGAWVTPWRIPNESELRFLAYTTLAYGGQGISYFNYYMLEPDTGGLQPAPDGTPTQVYTDLVPINRQFLEIAEEFQPLTSLGGFHLGDRLGGTQQLPGDSPFTLDPPIAETVYFPFWRPVNGMVVGLFGPDEQVTNATHALVMNLEYDTDKLTTVTSSHKLDVFDATSGTWSRTGNNQATLSLVPAGGKLLRISPDQGPGGSARSVWTSTGIANWHEASNWTDVGPADNRNETAVFGSMITDHTLVGLNSDITVTAVEFDSPEYSYAIAGHGSVSLQSDSALTVTPAIRAFSGTHEFQVPVNFTEDANVVVAAGSTLVFNNAVDLMGNTLTKIGAGELTLNNDLLTSGGMLDVQQGTVTGTASVSGDVVNSGGTVSPGNSPGTLEIDGDYAQGATANLLMEIAGTSPGTNYDVLIVAGMARLQGALNVVLLDEFEPQVDDTFDILNLTSIAGTFDELALPELTAGLAWDTSSLYTDGNLTVVPEPASLGLTLLALPSLLAVTIMNGIAITRRTPLMIVLLVCAVDARTTSAADNGTNLEFELVSEHSVYPYGGIPFCVDLDQDGAMDVLWLQSPGMFHSKVYDDVPLLEERHTDAGRNHFCLTATTADGKIMWQIGDPWQGNRPFVTHSAERSLDVADIDGDGRVEIVCIRLGQILVIDAMTGRVQQSTRAAADNAQIVVLGRTDSQPGGWNLLVKNAELAYAPYEYANPVWFYDTQLELIKTQPYLGAGHTPQARDLDGDGLDEFLIGFNLIGHDLEIRWTFCPVPVADWNALEMHVDDLTVGRAAERTVIAYAASDTAYLVDAADGSLLWKRQGTHPQHCQVGRFATGSGPLDVFIHNKRAELELFDIEGKQLYQIMPAVNFPLGQAEPCRRQKFHVFDPTTLLQAQGRNGTDLLIFTDAGWPYVIDGRGNRCCEFPYTENTAQDWGEVPGRPDDFGYGFYARVADFDADGENEVMLNDRRFAWLYEMEIIE